MHCRWCVTTPCRLVVNWFLQVRDSVVSELMLDHPRRDSELRSQLADILFVQCACVSTDSRFQARGRHEEFCRECTPPPLTVRMALCKQGVRAR